MNGVYFVNEQRHVWPGDAPHNTRAPAQWERRHDYRGHIATLMIASTCASATHVGLLAAMTRWAYNPPSAEEAA